MKNNIHVTSDVQSVSIGVNSYIWQFCVILKGAKIGSNCNICSHCLIENDVKIGDNVTVKSGVQLWDGITLENSVFVGPNVTFTNDLIPRSKAADWKLIRTIVQEGASIGANSTIIAGVTIGKYALIGAGSLVSKNIPPYTVWYGNPAKHMGYITESGKLISLSLDDRITCDKYVLIGYKPIKK